MNADAYQLDHVLCFMQGTHSLNDMLIAGAVRCCRRQASR
jgi:hypothetical protein